MEKKLMPEIKNNRFFNPEQFLGSSPPESLLFGTIPSFIRAIFSRIGKKTHDISEWVQSYHPVDTLLHNPHIFWIGHATFLIQINGVNILTDPVFGDLSFLFRRMLPPGIALDQLPKIDYVLLSHNHRDHMDTTSLIALKKKNPDLHCLVPHGDKNWFDRKGFKNVSEFGWWDEKLTSAIRFVFLPAAHWSRRGFFDRNKSLWGSWLIEAGERIYFAGDTAYGIHFAEIAKEFNPIDIALMPIGPCEPNDWMKKTHVSGDGSLQAFHDLQASHFVPMHWGTFPLGIDQFDDPIKRLQSGWVEHEHKKLHIIKVGQRLSINAGE